MSGFSEQTSKSNSRVESILVCTGVYNPENDLLIYLRSLFNSSSIKDGPASQKEKEEDTMDSNNNLTNGPKSIRRHDSNVSLNAHELMELQSAMSRKNSFISYFDDKKNVPDLTVNTLKDACDYIIKTVREQCVQ